MVTVTVTVTVTIIIVFIAGDLKKYPRWHLLMLPALGVEEKCRQQERVKIFITYSLTPHDNR